MDRSDYILRCGAQQRLEPAELGEFLLLFSAVYRAAVQLIRAESDYSSDTHKAFANQVAKFLRNLDVGGLNALFDASDSKYRLLTARISKQSPLEILGNGFVEALLAAIILSGGKLKLGSLIEADIPPLAEGIERLKKLFAPRAATNLGYGVQTLVVKLNKKEFEELFKYDSLTSSQGGFQRFFLALQTRINKNTRKIELTTSDVETIVKYGRNPQKGGFQKSLRFIFGRHVRFDA